MTFRTRFWIAAAVGLWVAHSVPGQEPARIDVEHITRLVPAISPTSNQHIADTVADHLRQSGQLRQYDVQVVFQNGTAELSGSVANQAQREEVLRIVQGVPGVERVRDYLAQRRHAEVTRTQALDPVIPENAPAPRKSSELAAAAVGAPVEPVPVFQAPAPSYSDVNPPRMPPYAWPTYAPYDNLSRVAYPQLYPYNSWPFIGPFYPFPKVPPGWRSVSLTWQDGHWFYGKHATGHDWWRLRYW